MAEEEQQLVEKYEKGDRVVRFGRVYEIFKITQEPKLEGEGTEEVIHFKPVYENIANRSLTCSIPMDNIDKTNMRRPLSEEEIDELLKFIKKTILMKKRFNTRQAKEVLKSNEPDKIAMILKKLAIVKHDPDTNFTYTKKRIFRKALQRLEEEVALVREMDLDEAHEMLIDLLDKQGKRSLAATQKALAADEEDEE